MKVAFSSPLLKWDCPGDFWLSPRLETPPSVGNLCQGSGTLTVKSVF